MAGKQQSYEVLLTAASEVLKLEPGNYNRVEVLEAIYELCIQAETRTGDDLGEMCQAVCEKVMEAACHIFVVWNTTISHFLDSQIGKEGVKRYLTGRPKEEGWSFAICNLPGLEDGESILSEKYIQEGVEHYEDRRPMHLLLKLAKASQAEKARPYTPTRRQSGEYNN